MTKDEAMKLALEALEMYLLETNSQFQRSAVTALREALALVNKVDQEQPSGEATIAQQEPLGYLYELIVEGQVVNEKFTSVNWDTRYEPFGRNGVDHGGEVTKTPLYTPPPAQRTWVGLTDEERQEIWKGCDPTHAGYVTALVEAKLKEKNTP